MGIFLVRVYVCACVRACVRVCDVTYLPLHVYDTIVTTCDIGDVDFTWDLLHRL
jgi:hypothetical protein